MAAGARRYRDDCDRTGTKYVQPACGFLDPDLEFTDDGSVNDPAGDAVKEFAAAGSGAASGPVRQEPASDSRPQAGISVPWFPEGSAESSARFGSAQDV